MRAQLNTPILTGALALLAILLAGASLRAVESKPNADPNVIVEFDVAQNGDFLLLPVEVAGQRQLFIANTSSLECVLDVRLGAQLESIIQRRRAPSTDGEPQFELIDSAPVFLGPMKLRTDSRVLAVDFSGLEKIIGSPVRGGIGWSFLSQHIFRIDFDRGKLAFLKKLEPNGAEAIEFRLIEGLPHVRCSIGKFDVEFGIETGQNKLGSLEEGLLTKLLAEGSVRDVRETGIRSLAGDSKQRMLRANEFHIQEFGHADLEFVSSDRNGLGLGYWRRYVVTIDGPGNKLYLKRGANYLEDGRRVESGFQPSREEGVTRVIEVYPDTPAAKAGLQAGDEFVSVNGRAASESSMFELSRVFSQPDTTVKVRVRRGDQEHDLTIVLPPAE